jgi:S1-C subfamily serine protease
MPLRFLLPTLVLVAGSLCAAADEPANDPAADSWAPAARTLQQATVTVRLWGLAASEDQQPAAVTVCTGLCVGKGRIITAALAASDTPIRLTLAGGKQADAKLRVVDEYSGLALLNADTALLAPLKIAEALPAVGSELLAASAWGLEAPLVSRGLVGGVDRKLGTAAYPPLVQCDLLSTQTSTGAGLVDRQGRLVGVIVAADRAGGNRGWSYAVPAAHVTRLLRAAEAGQGEGGQAQGVMVLKRRRPVVGMVLDQEATAIVVQRVAPGGPAAQAGIEPGDEVVAADGVVIRSVYQAVLSTMHKQPGDTASFRIRRAGMLRDVAVVLGGGVEIEHAPADVLAQLIQPKVRLARDGQGEIVASRGPATPAVAVLPPLPDDTPPPTAPTAADKIALLEMAVGRYQAVIEIQQKRLADEQDQRQKQEAQLQSLRAEIESLRRAITPP